MHIGGRDVAGSGWTYVVHVDALIGDPSRALAIRRAAARGERLGPEDAGVIAGRCAHGGEHENLAALEAAAAASRSFGRTTTAERKAIGDGFHARLLECAGELTDILVAEGHPRVVAEWEVDGMVQSSSPKVLDWAFAQMSHSFRDGGRRMRLVRKPDGVVCVNPPQNAAAANASLGMTAVLAGNAVVVKAPRTTPLGTMYAVREIFLPVLEAHGAPPGTVNLISGHAKPILDAWVRSPLVDDIMFFGDSRTGLRLGGECVAHGKKPILELSGKDAVLVWADADLDGAADALAECFHGSSQLCMAPKQAVLHPAIAADFTERLLARVAAIRPAPLSDPGAVLSPVLKMGEFFEFLYEARDAGCEVLCGGERVGLDGTVAADGAFIQPTVVLVRGLAGARRLRSVRDETFFPLLPLVVADDAGTDDATLLETILAWIDDNPYGLRNSLWARDEGVIDAFASAVGNGGLLKVNDSHLGFAPYLATHGGTGLTGGPHGELNYPLFRTSHLQGIAFGDGGAAAA